ncbi:MAG: iron-containing redox enzyme family protein [Saprospiraceae bacterium]
MDFFSNLQTDLQPGINRILKHPFLERIANAQLNPEQLKYFSGQYSIYCTYFPRFLAACAAAIPDDPTRMPIVKNLWEEHGSGEMASSHRVLFENFAVATGWKVEELKKVEPLSSTHICVEYLLNLCQEGHFLKSLGALGPGTESFTSQEYAVIAGGLAKYPKLSAEDIRFWTVHITLDEDHYAEMVAPLQHFTTNPDYAMYLTEGAKRAIDLEILFWDGLEEHLPGK